LLGDLLSGHATACRTDAAGIAAGAAGSPTARRAARSSSEHDGWLAEILVAVTTCSKGIKF
jgi:hypothetical protein